MTPAAGHGASHGEAGASPDVTVPAASDADSADSHGGSHSDEALPAASEAEAHTHGDVPSKESRTLRLVVDFRVLLRGELKGHGEALAEELLALGHGKRGAAFAESFAQHLKHSGQAGAAVHVDSVSAKFVTGAAPRQGHGGNEGYGGEGSHAENEGFDGEGALAPDGLVEGTVALTLELQSAQRVPMDESEERLMACSRA